MGIPAFYSWLRRRFPSVTPTCAPVSIDFLYIDLNSLLYPCLSQENSMFLDLLDPLTQQRIFDSLFLVLDEIINKCKVSQSVMLAVDGVCPRVKMNQQRQRRYYIMAWHIFGYFRILQDILGWYIMGVQHRYLGITRHVFLYN